MAVSFAESVYNQDDEHIVRSGVVTSVFDSARGHEYAANDQDYFASEDRYAQVQDEAHDDSHQDVEELFLEAGQTSDRDRLLNLANESQFAAVFDILDHKIETTNLHDPDAFSVLAETFDQILNIVSSKDAGQWGDALNALFNEDLDVGDELAWDEGDSPETVLAAEERSCTLYEKLEAIRISAATHVPEAYQPADAEPQRKPQAPTYALFTPPSPSF